MNFANFLTFLKFLILDLTFLYKSRDRSTKNSARALKFSPELTNSMYFDTVFLFCTQLFSAWLGMGGAKVVGHPVCT